MGSYFSYHKFVPQDSDQAHLQAQDTGIVLDHPQDQATAVPQAIAVSWALDVVAVCLLIICHLPMTQIWA